MASREETDTVITWTADDDKATVYSMMPKVWRWCQKVGGIEIRLEEGIRNGKKEARTFLVDPLCIRIRPKRRPSPKQLAALDAARAAQNEQEPA
jgi:hypothetical protein